MDEEQYVPSHVYLRDLKSVLVILQEQSVGLYVLKAALMLIPRLPVSAEQLKALDVQYRQTPEFLAMTKAISDIPTDSPDKISEMLKMFEGPTQ